MGKVAVKMVYVFYLLFCPIQLLCTWFPVLFFLNQVAVSKPAANVHGTQLVLPTEKKENRFIVTFNLIAKLKLNLPETMRYHYHALHPNCIVDAVERVALLLFAHNKCANFDEWCPIELSNCWCYAMIYWNCTQFN